MKRIKRGAFTLSLNIQLSLVVVLSILFSFAVLFGLLSVLGPIVESRVAPYFNRVDNEITALDDTLTIANEQGLLTVSADGTSPYFEAMELRPDGYTLETEFIPGLTYDQLMDQPALSKLFTNSYQVSIHELPDGLFIIGADVPAFTLYTALAIVFSVTFFLLILLTILVIFFSRKTRYIKTISNKLDTIAAGDLDVIVPVKGMDELTNLARHINEMTLSLSDHFEREKTYDSMKQQLVAGISHDLRTPLTAVIGHLSLLDQEWTVMEESQKRQSIQVALGRSQSVSHLVDQLFDYVLYTNHQVALHLQQLDPALLFVQLVDSFEPLVREKQMTLLVDLATVSKTYALDSEKLQRVVGNLMSNIAKYGAQQSQVTIYGKGTDQGAYELTFTNKMNQQVSHLPLEPSTNLTEWTETYFTSDRVSGRSAGLGLAICREIIEHHGGTMDLSSDGDLLTVTLRFY